MRLAGKLLRYLAWLVVFVLVVLVVVGGVLVLLGHPWSQSYWYGPDTFKIEVGPLARYTMPTNPAGSYPLPDSYNPAVVERSGLAKAVVHPGSFTNPTKADCVYDNHPLLTIAGFSVRYWKCEP